VGGGETCSGDWGGRGGKEKSTRGNRLFDLQHIAKGGVLIDGNRGECSRKEIRPQAKLADLIIGGRRTRRGRSRCCGLVCERSRQKNESKRRPVPRCKNDGEASFKIRSSVGHRKERREGRLPFLLGRRREQAKSKEDLSPQQRSRKERLGLIVGSSKEIEKLKLRKRGW